MFTEFLRHYGRTAKLERGVVQKLESNVEKKPGNDPHNEGRCENVKSVSGNSVQKRANLVELEKCRKNNHFVAKIGFDTAESGPSKNWVTGIPVYR